MMDPPPSSHSRPAKSSQPRQQILPPLSTSLSEDGVGVRPHPRIVGIGGSSSTSSSSSASSRSMISDPITTPIRLPDPTTSLISTTESTIRTSPDGYSSSLSRRSLDNLHDIPTSMPFLPPVAVGPSSSYHHSIPASKYLPPPLSHQYHQTGNYSDGSSAMKVLSAERFDDAIGSHRAHEAAVRGVELHQRNPVILGVSAEEDQVDSPERSTVEPQDEAEPTPPRRGRKRQRQEITTAEVALEPVKKNRGRPRLAVTDENAADRRRTQIRMAQRAYRQRKETTIQDLEKQVQELKGNNEEMNNIFTNIFDMVAQSGLMKREPDLWKRFQRGSERFSRLTKAIGPGESSTDDDHLNDGARRRSSSGNQVLAVSELTEPTLSSQAWEYHPPRSLSGSESNSAASSLPHLTLPVRNANLEVITRATPQNASFSFDIDLESLENFQAEMPPETALDFEIPDSLPLDTSYAHNELTFARQLQRSAAQKGYQLLTSEHPDPLVVKRVFGFTLSFHSMEKIISRLRAVVDADAREDLSVWNQPFLNVGGSGTHYPGQSVGPFDQETSNARDTLLTPEMRLALPGYEGELYDPHDVEGYLRSKGFEIPPNSAQILVKREIYAKYEPGRRNLLRKIHGFSPNSPPRRRAPYMRGPMGFVFEGDISNDADKDDSNVNSQPESQYPEDVSASSGLDDWTMSTSMTAGSISGKDAEFTPYNTTAVGRSSNLMDFNSSSQDAIAISVDLLIAEILKHTVCLGRSPGFRPADVETAVEATIRATLMT